jgi:hypothetical protein
MREYLNDYSNYTDYSSHNYNQGYRDGLLMGRAAVARVTPDELSSLTADELLTLSKMRRADIAFDLAVKYVLSERS